MAKQLNVDLNYRVNTAQVKQQIEQLQVSLNKIAFGTDIKINDNSIKSAAQAAKELSIHLNNAYNADTGNFDLSRLDKSLRTSKQNITDLSTSLLKAGDAGQQAFVQLAQSIAAADRPLVSINSRLKEFSTTMKNTARWQLSSSMLHGFMGAVQSAYGYAQDLNESLNNIRIVTGYNTDQMSKFAVEANRAAKALSTTTTEYTNASLIYYQQGLNDSEVKARTDVTIKMANAAGVSAEKVSDQLTAIWNNFYDGSKSLEYYADVMTALGAATASSTDEIAGGLEKFAAIGNTIGLSYEYAASALATITSNTRQSEEVVGTALKTIFARIQGLNLGETLDDGVTLNKYSEALQKVGISVFDASGQLKDMDNILDEMAAKWETLGRAEQTALAQTVAGVRQYTQLVALMENWDNGDSDSMTSNLKTAIGSTGSLQAQADVYAESWDAARDRVTAAAEDIYDTLLNDKFFIAINNGFAGLLNSLDGFIDGIGGLKGVVGFIGSFFLSTISGKITPALENLKHNATVIFQSAEQQAKRISGELNEVIDNKLKTENFSQSSRTSLENAKELNSARAKLAVIENQLTDTEKQRYNQELNIIKANQQEAQVIADRITKLKEEKEAILDKESTTQLTNFGQDTYKQVSKAAENDVNAYRNVMYDMNAEEANESSVQYAIEAYTNAKNAASQLADAQEVLIAATAGVDDAFREMGSNIDFSKPSAQIAELGTVIKTEFSGALTDIEQRLITNKDLVDSDGSMFKSFRDQIDLAVAAMPRVVRESDEVQKALAEVWKAKDSKDLLNVISALRDKLQKTNIPAEELTKILKEINPKRYADLKNNAERASKAMEELRKKQLEVNKAVNGFNPEHKMGKLEAITKTAAAFGQLSMAISSVQSLINIWQNQDMSFGEKLVSSLMSISMIVPSVIGSIKNLNAVTGLMTTINAMAAAANEKYAITNAAKVATLEAEALAKQKNISLGQAQNLISIARMALLYKEVAGEQAKVDALTAEQIVEKTGMSLDAAKIVLNKLQSRATLAEALAEAGLTSTKWGSVAATIAQIAATLGLKTVMSPLLVVTLLLAAAFIAISVAALGIVHIFNKLSDAYNADAIAAEKAVETAEQLADSYNRCKEEYEAMVASMENYKSARDALDELTKGTEEYEKALQKANRAGIELLASSGKFNTNDYYWDNGELIINEDAMNRIKNELAKEESTAYAAMQMANINASRATNQSNITDFKRESSSDIQLGRKEAYKSAVDTVLAAFENNPNLLGGNLNTFTKSINDLGIIDNKLIEALYSNKASLEKLGNDIIAANEQEKLFAQQTANEIMSGQGYENSVAGRMALEAGGEVYQQLYKDAINKYSKDMKMANFWGVGTDEGKAAWSRYAEATGLNNLNGYTVTNYRKDGSVEYEYIDDQGQKQQGIATKEMIAQTLAAADAAGQLETSLAELRNQITELNASNDIGDHALADFLSTGNFDNSTKGEYNNLKNDIENITDANGNKVQGLDNQVDWFLDKQFGDGKDGIITDETAKKYGYESAEKMKQALIEALDVDWDIPSGIGANIADKLTAGASNQIRNNFEKLGSEGGQAYLDIINTIGDSVNLNALTPEEQNAMWAEIASIDTAAWDAGKRYAEVVEKYGGAIDETSQAWQKNINIMRDAADAIPDFEKLKSDLTTMKDLASDIEIGDILSEEDYDLLVSYNKELEKYFTLLSDGTAMFIGDKLDFKQEVDELAKQELINAKNVIGDLWSEVQIKQASGAQAVGGMNNLSQYRDSENYIGNDGQNYYNKDNVNTQLDFLTSQGYDSEQIDSWKADLADGGTTVQVLNEIAAAVDQTATSYEGLQAKAADLQAQYNGLAVEIAMTAESAQERVEMLSDGTINLAGYAAAAFASINEEKWEGFDDEEVEAAEDYAKHLMEIADESDLVSDSLADNEEAAEEVARVTMKLNRGIDKLADGYEDWSDVLKNSNKGSKEFSEAMTDMKDAMSDVLNVSEEFISDDFILNNLEAIQKAATGDEEAIQALHAALSKDLICQVVGVSDFTQLDADLQHLHEKLWNLSNQDIEVGAYLNDDEFLKTAQELIDNAGMTVEQAQAYFNSLGYEPEFATETVKTVTNIPNTRTHTDYAISMSNVDMGILGTWRIPTFDTIQSSWAAGYTPIEQEMEVPMLSAEGTPILKGATRVGTSGSLGNYSSHNSGGKSPGSSSGGGGSSSSSTPKKADTVNKTEIVDRYKEINDSLDDIIDAANKASTAMDRLYGVNKIKGMQQINALLQKEIELLEQKKAEAINYLAEDKAALQEAAAEAGVSFSFDESDNIRNYETQMTALYNLLDAAIQSANADGDATDEEQEAIDAIQEKIDAVKDAIAQYDETRELITDLDQEAQEKFNEWQDNNFEILNYTLELKLEVNDDNLQRLEYYIGKLEDDFYQMAESAALMVGNDGQWDQYTQNIEDYRAYLARLKEDYEAGRISEDAYVEGVKEVKDGIYENLESLNELDKTMMEYYGETLAAAGEEIAKYTDLMEHQTSVLEHYNSVMELLNKQNDYAAMGVILEAQATLAENAVKVSQANYEMYAAEVAEREAALRAAQSRGASQAEIELLEQEWWAAQEAASEAQDQMISDVEAWAEAINAVLDNKLGSLAQALENSLTGDYGSFNEMTSAMERANSLQEEYLTTTNKVYETNKLMRTAQQEIDKTTNSLAKTRLKQFINETQQLQDQTELSQYELEIQQAKYDLLLAEIALEEAQAAKSTVRLQRDSEGNFGYVYTADESQIADAQQKLEDAQNSLYNIALEGANNYSQKYAETLREMNDTLIEINEAYRNGEYENEQEYQDALMAAREYYYEKMKQYSELYQVAIVTDGRVVEEAWSSEFANMTMETEQWMWAVDEYIANIRDAFSLWEEQMDRIADLTVGPDLDSLKEKVSGVVDVNTELADSITQDVIPGIQAEIDAVKKITSAYSLAREARLRYIRAGEQVANTAAQDLGEYIDNFDWSNTSGGSSSGNNSGNSDSSSNTGNGGSTSGGNGSGNESSSESGPLTWDRIMSAYNQIVSGAWGNGVANRIKRGVAAGYTEEEVRAAQKYINYTFPKNQNGYGYSKAKAKELLGFDTGGYTGDWAGSYGKLALLHKKELILEPGDTENFLDAMNILDRIVQMIDLQAMSSQFGGIMSAPGMGNMNNGVLEQMVHIEAHFEGATDRYEIEAAFDNLINRASQQANQK